GGALAAAAPLLAAEAVGVAARGAAAAPAPPAATAADDFELAEVTIAELQASMAAGRQTSRGLVEAYLERIAALDRRGPELRALLEVNPEALAIADALDAERRAKGLRGTAPRHPHALQPHRPP